MVSDETTDMMMPLFVEIFIAVSVESFFEL